jgi:hypothetical protein
MTKKSFILVFALLMVLAFAPMALAGDVAYEYGAYQTEYGTAYDILPAPVLDGFEMTSFVSIQAGKPILAPVYTDQGGAEYVLVSPANQSLNLYWFFPWDVSVQMGNIVLVPLTEANFVGFGGQDSYSAASGEAYFVRNLVPRNYPFWL